MIKPQAMLLIGALVATGVAANFVPRPSATKRTEAWMESQLPVRVGDFEFVPSAQNPMQSYKMEKTTYETLKPFGIVSRVYSKSGEQYDVVVVTSDNGDSFHDPSICFQSQGSELENQSVGKVETKSRGTIPVTFLKTSYNGQPRVAAYCYKGPGGMISGSFSILMDLFRGELSSGRTQEGTFYRFISLHSGATEANLNKFIGDYLDAAAESSKGYY